MTAPSLGAKGGRGALYGIAGQFGKLGLNLISLAVLSRLLLPEEYGVVAMVTAVVGIAELVRDMGLSTAAIRADSLSAEEKSNLWWLNTGLGALCMLAVMASAPLLGMFYGRSDVVGVALVLSVTFLIGGMTTQYVVQLARDLRFGVQAVINIVSLAVGVAVAIVMALIGAGYWALVANQLISGVLGLVLMVWAVRWLPGRYRRDVPMRQFFGIGLPVFGANVLTYVGSNLDAMLVGRFFGAGNLGYYNRGMMLVRMPLNQLRNPLSTVALATLSKVRDDGPTYLRYVSKAQITVMYPIVFLGTLVAAGAEDGVRVVLGEQWVPIAILVTFFALGDAVNTLPSSGSWIYTADGKTLALMKYTIFSSVLRIVLFVVMIPFGLTAVASVYLIAALINWPISILWCQHATGRRLGGIFLESLRVFLVFAVVFAVTATVAYVLPEWNSLIRMFILLAVHAAALALIVAIVPPVRKDAQTVLSTLRTALGR